MTPKARSSLRESEKYSLTAGMGSRKSAEYPSRKSNAGGKTIKYPNAAPPRKQKDEIKENGNRTFFSCLYKPGATNLHTCQIMTGLARSTPQTRANFR